MVTLTSTNAGMQKEYKHKLYLIPIKPSIDTIEFQSNLSTKILLTHFLNGVPTKYHRAFQRRGCIVFSSVGRSVGRSVRPSVHRYTKWFPIIFLKTIYHRAALFTCLLIY